MNLAENYPIEMRSLLKRMIELYNKSNAKTIRDALPDDYVGHAFVPKGAVATVADLPATGNTVGDLYHVEEDQSEYVWLPTTDYPDGHWENVGPDSEPKKLIVTLTNSGTVQSPVYSADKTFVEIIAALSTGKTVELHSDDTIAYLIAHDNSSYIEFAYYIHASDRNRLISRSYTVDDNDIWSYCDSTYLQDPATVTDLSSTSITLTTAANNTNYEYGTLTALTISSVSISATFSLSFTSGSTPTVLTVPNTMIMPDGFAVEANTRYEINCKDGYALVAGWAVGA